MKVNVLANRKGGVGKLPLACNLTVCAAKDGLHVATMDADRQGISMHSHVSSQGGAL